ncbi:zinc ribbon domain-containing protein [Paucilactobacillus nenjiangensis]|uniref:site-specific DNA-methyltransferase (adenine-specific) n=1 Tax=Paucilactobacillus nenjiangensis TaxID=1296540 RepID=A0A5P1X237_9LACO|nr:zinc ribbon domain-containing protein [Paucilactobacillus nenjiangensis]QER66729.1 hypothetical protein F0161_01840 [Paucilactobacillus nenjiangensis]
MAVKKSELYSLLWEACNKLRGGVEPSRYKDYVLVLLFFKYVSDRYKGQRFAEFTVNEGASFDDLIAAKGKPDVGERVDVILQKFLEDNKLVGALPDVSFNNPDELGSGKELVDKVSGLIAIFQNPIHRRSNIYTGASKNKRIYSSKYALSAITFCGDCGNIYRRTYWNIHGRKEFVWRCVTRIEQGPEVCKNRTVKEDELYGAVMTAINKLLAGGNNMIKTLEENIHAVIGETTEYQISEINNLLEEKQKELIKLANKGQDYEHLADEIDELRDKRQILLVEDASLSGENERINELIEFIRKNKFRTLEYDDKLVRKIIQSVTVYEDHFVIAFKSGIEMEI